ncbi:flagellar hook-length control protein FliK [Flexibacterium corallicola]|uniref:flagellar hook-length control protein FliK n=1 Tax=Flexibacterium corallicola TaxID=3037259 RepID=UPI00286EDA1E|nr:flagellar hook-length control protein FliK [Pseudovibrio sp. M1P-2-3]
MGNANVTAASANAGNASAKSEPAATADNSKEFSRAMDEVSKTDTGKGEGERRSQADETAGDEAKSNSEAEKVPAKNNGEPTTTTEASAKTSDLLKALVGEASDAGAGEEQQVATSTQTGDAEQGSNQDEAQSVEAIVAKLENAGKNEGVSVLIRPSQIATLGAASHGAASGLVNYSGPLKSARGAELQQTLSSLGTRGDGIKTVETTGVQPASLSVDQSTKSAISPKQGEAMMPVSSNVKTELATNTTASLDKASDPLMSSAPISDGETVDVKVIKSESHLPPTLETRSPIRQISEGILKTFTQGAEASRASNSNFALDNPAKSLETMKSLEIQLRPDNLGTVRVSMQLRGGELEITMMASSRETADLLQRDQNTLTKILREAGYRTETATVTVSSSDNGSDLARQQQNGDRASSGQGERGQLSEEGEQSSSHQRDEQASYGNEEQQAGGRDETEDTSSLRDGLYL